jgi:hypothetical protein
MQARDGQRALTIVDMNDLSRCVVERNGAVCHQPARRHGGRSAVIAKSKKQKHRHTPSLLGAWAERNACRKAEWLRHPFASDPPGHPARGLTAVAAGFLACGSLRLSGLPDTVGHQ